MPGLRGAALALFLSFMLAPPAAMAWGPLGHRIVAALAWRQLDPTARTATQQLLAAGHWESLVAASTWPDEIRDMPRYQRLWKQSRRMHYINFGSRDCDYVPPRDCRDGECVVAAIAHDESALANHRLSARQRSRALVFLVHFIGDVHQPLHAGYRHDAGGNAYQVRFEGKGTNLHHVWDSSLLRTRHMDWRQYADFLATEGPVTLPATEPGMAPTVQWAEESCRITRHIYPRGHRIGTRYVQHELPVAERRLREAGARLAAVLNRILG